MGRTINSPGVEINEIDLSLKTPKAVGTRILINGFTDQGPAYEPLELESLSHYEEVFGYPVTSAERYSYNAVKLLFQQTSASVTFQRLPYGTNPTGESEDKYVALFYPVFYSGEVSGVDTTIVSGGDITYSNLIPSDEGTFYIGRPVAKVYTEDEYRSNFLEGNYTWGASTIAPIDYGQGDNLENSGFVVINKLKSVVNQSFEGYYIGITDNEKASVDNDDVYDSITGLMTTKKLSMSGEDSYTVLPPYAWDEVPDSRTSFPLTGMITDGKGSMSESIEKSPDWNFGDSIYDNSIVLNVFKTFETGYSNKQNTLSYTRVENIIGSFTKNSTFTDPNGFTQTSFDIETKINNQSTYLEMYVNPNFKNIHWCDDDGKINKKVRIIDDSLPSSDFDSSVKTTFEEKLNAIKAFSIGLYADSMDVVKEIGGVPKKLEMALRRVEDWRKYPIDIILDNGLSTIYTTCSVNNLSEFDDTVHINVETKIDDIKTKWLEVVEELFNINRKDCMSIIDLYRNIFIDGSDYKIEDDKGYAFSTDIYPYLKKLVDIVDTSYGVTYSQWIKGYDGYTNDEVWYPYSAYQASIMARTDKNKFPWYAPAGLENGQVVGALDIALNTNQAERDLLYRININPVVSFPNQGIVAWGQKTLQKKPSAFDRINVRRMFLTIEKATRAVMDYFVFEQNSIFTRNRVVNVLTPILDVPKNNQGILEYKIVCDERNNTPTVIDNNELRVSIYIKPIKSAEFVLVDFYSTRTDQDFKELV